MLFLDYPDIFAGKYLQNPTFISSIITSKKVGHGVEEVAIRRCQVWDESELNRPTDLNWFLYRINHVD